MSKDKKHFEQPNKDPQFMDAEFAYNNALALPQEVKDYLNDKGLDWRFLNATQFRSAGGYHRSHWRAFNITPEIAHVTTTAEGLIQRGDLILGVRPKAISAKHREFLKDKVRRQSGDFAKAEADKMREDLRRKGLSGIKVEDGYDEDDSGFKSND